jgi:hypothetical protein
MAVRSRAWGAGTGSTPYPVVLKLGRSEDGQVIGSGMILGGNVVESSQGQVTAGSLRSIPLGLILDELSRGLAKGAPWLSKISLRSRPTRLGPRGIPIDRLREVAQLYRRALASRPSAPVKWMSEQIRGPEGRPTPTVTVRRWLQRCRDLGFLGPATPGKAGERPTKARRTKRR